jgi:transposase-like protein
VCPVCGATHETARFWRLKDKKTLKCSNCNKRFNVKIGTVFEETRLSLRKWFIAIFLLTSHTKGISSVQLAKDLKVTQKTAWFLAHRIRRATENFMATNESKFTHAVEADETYVGGLNKNKHKDKKIKGAQGRNTLDKLVAFGIMQRKTEDSDAKVIAYNVESVDSNTLQNEITKNVDSNATVYTDEWKGYSKLKYAYKHEYIKHSLGEYVNNEIHTNTIEGFWSLFKRMFVGTYHSMSKKHLNKYLNELSFRYNHMKSSSNDIFKMFVSKCTGRLSYKGLTA